MKSIDVLKFGSSTAAPNKVSIEDFNDSHTDNLSLATAGFTFNVSSGNIDSQNFGVIQQWLDAGGVASDYEILVSPTSGNFSTGTINTWLRLDANRSWTRNNAISGTTKTVTAVVQLRAYGFTDVIDSCTVILEATFE